MTRRDRQLPLQRLAARQGGHVTRSQLRDLGYSAKAERYRLELGVWERTGNVVSVDRFAAPRDLRDAWLVHLLAGPGSVVTGPVAARLGGIAIPGAQRLAFVSAHATPTCPGVRIIASDRRLNVIAGPPPLTAPHDAVMDSLAHLDRDAATSLLDHCLQRRIVSPEDLTAAINGRANLLGVGQLRRLAARAGIGARSEGEHRILPLVRRAGGGPWIANYRVVRNAAGEIAEIDLADPALRIGIEVDGRAYHVDHASFERDRARQNDLVLLGWIILRFTWAQITTQPEWVVAQVRAAVRTRAA